MNLINNITNYKQSIINYNLIIQYNIKELLTIYKKNY